MLLKECLIIYQASGLQSLVLLSRKIQMILASHLPYICKSLLEERAEIVIHDPRVDFETILSSLNGNKSLTDESRPGSIDFVNNPYEAVENAHVLVVLTEWG